MKITLPKSAFDSELDMVSSVVKTRTTLPVLGFVKLETGAGSQAISLWSTDLDCYYKRTVNANIMESGECLLPARRVREWLAGSGDGQLTVESTEKAVLLSVDGRDPIHLATLPAMEFPPFPKSEGKIVAETDLSGITDVASASSSPGSGRPNLECVFIEPEEDGLIAAATNARALAAIKLKADVKEKEKIALPSPFASLAAGMGSCSIEQSDNFIRLTSPSATLVVKRMDGVMIPDWRKAINLHPRCGSMKVVADEFNQAIRACHVLREEHGFARTDSSIDIRLDPKPSGLQISCQSQYGKHSETIDGKQDGECPSILFNSRLMVDMLRLIGENMTAISLDFTRPDHAMHVDLGGVDYWLMPLGEKAKATQ